MNTIFLESLGCKLNQAELESLIEQFVQAGYHIADNISDADVYVLNTCTVTHIADRKSRHLIRMARRNNPDILIVVTGCHTVSKPEELAAMGEVNCIVNNEDKEQIPGMVTAILEKKRLKEDNKITLNLPLRKGVKITNEGQYFRTRSLIKIQEGCNNYCTFCIVPRVRGRSRSIPESVILDEIKSRVTVGYKEITLTGTRIGDYEVHDTGSTQKLDLVDLVSNIINSTEIERIRLSSLGPQDLNAELIQLFHNRRICRHIHVSLQSGSDTVLQRMKRTYITKEYERAVAFAKQAIPGLAVTTDVIVGFPGESPEEFEESYNFCHKMNFARIHVFPYSRRPGTLAGEMAEQVGVSEKQRRMRRMLELAREARNNFEREFIGQILPVLWEQEEKTGLWSGLTDNYIRVFTNSDKDITNRIISTELYSIIKEGVLGKLC